MKKLTKYFLGLLPTQDAIYLGLNKCTPLNTQLMQLKIIKPGDYTHAIEELLDTYHVKRCYCVQGLTSTHVVEKSLSLPSKLTKKQVKQYVQSNVEQLLAMPTSSLRYNYSAMALPDKRTFIRIVACDIHQIVKAKRLLSTARCHLHAIECCEYSLGHLIYQRTGKKSLLAYIVLGDQLHAYAIYQQTLLHIEQHTLSSDPLPSQLITHQKKLLAKYPFIQHEATFYPAHRPPDQPTNRLARHYPIRELLNNGDQSLNIAVLQCAALAVRGFRER